MPLLEVLMAGVETPVELPSGGEGNRVVLMSGGNKEKIGGDTEGEAVAVAVTLVAGDRR